MAAHVAPTHVTGVAPGLTLIARSAGACWTDIGRSAGISRQSAQERWVRTKKGVEEHRREMVR